MVASLRIHFLHIIYILVQASGHMLYYQYLTVGIADVTLLDTSKNSFLVCLQIVILLNVKTE